jgi:threonine 3-dehydrogenase
MKAVVKRDLKGAVLEEVAVPACGDFDVLVEVLAASICGSDINRYNWESGKGPYKFKTPMILGHELCGRIVQTGACVTHWEPGQLVVAETHIPCGRCYQCETGNSHICAGVQVFGFHTDGCFANYFSFPSICARPLPKGVSIEEGPLMEPLGVAYHALSKSNINGDTVAIIGCGPIGLLAVQVASSMGAAHIIAMSRSEFKLDLAKKFGAGHILDVARENPVEEVLSITGGQGVGTVIECSGDAAAFTQGLKMARKGGTFVAVGIPKRPLEVDVAGDIVRKELTIHGMHGRHMFKTWYSITALVEQGVIEFGPLLTAKLPLEEFEEAFSLAQSKEHLKVLLIP